MYKILAVSGGIDSVTMLHLYRNDEQVVVAHFNHGIRDNANDDEEFVRDLAKKYKKPYFTSSANLGSRCSEDLARKERYSFLQSLSQELGGKVYTAHHKGDLVETVIINLTRGTGWRGLTPFENPNLIRPLLNWQKSDIYRYADKNQLIWRQDQSNTEGDYLRNRIRRRLLSLDVSSRENLQKELDKLIAKQQKVRKEIERTLNSFLTEDNRYERAWFSSLDDQIATEILRAALAKAGRSATRPELLRFLDAIRSYRSGKYFNLSKNYLVYLRKTDFVLQ